MPRRNSLLGKPCGCPDDAFHWTEIRNKEIVGPIIREYSSEVKICQKHNLPWGPKRKITRTLRSASPLNLTNLDPKIVKLLKSVFIKLYGGRINISVLFDKIKKPNPTAVVEELIQRGILTQITKTQSNNREKSYLEIPLGERDKLSGFLGFLSKDLQITLSRDIITTALSNSAQTTMRAENKEKNSSAKAILFRILRDQLSLIDNGQPGWNVGNGKSINPTNSSNASPVYLIISAGLVTWLQYWRPIMTMREISAKAFQNFPVDLEGFNKKFEDPSKILEQYSGQLSKIFEAVEIPSLSSLGLIEKPQFFHCSGELEVVHENGQRETHKRPVITLSNLEYDNISRLLVPTATQTLLLVENLAVFAHLVHESWALDNDALLVYMGGKGLQITKDFPRLVCESNPNVEIWIWVDHDLGGCQIFEMYASFIDPSRCRLIRILPDEGIPCRPNPPTSIPLLEKYARSKWEELASFARHILDSGKIEQEYFLDRFPEIFQANLARRKSDMQKGES